MNSPARPLPATHRRFEALGSYVHVAVPEATLLESACAIATDVLGAVDAACSRFRGDSDLSRANAGVGGWVRVDPLLVAAVRVGLDAAHATDGLVDPCLGRTLVSLGYDADLAAVRRRPDTNPRSLQAHPVDAWREVRVEEAAVRVPHGVALDLGATAKAWAADLTALAIHDRLGRGLVVSLGGDVRVIDDEVVPAWAVAVSEHPDDPTTTVWVDGGGLATSSTVVRRWRSGGVERHHLVDPRTGRPVAGPWRTVSATGPTSTAANVATTAALVLGEEAVDWLTERRVDARLVAQDGRLHHTGGWPAAPAMEGGAA